MFCAHEAREADVPRRAGNVLDRGHAAMPGLQRLLHRARSLIPSASRRRGCDHAKLVVAWLGRRRCGQGDGQNDDGDAHGQRHERPHSTRLWQLESLFQSSFGS